MKDFLRECVRGKKLTLHHEQGKPYFRINKIEGVGRSHDPVSGVCMGFLVLIQGFNQSSKKNKNSWVHLRFTVDFHTCKRGIYIKGLSTANPTCGYFWIYSSPVLYAKFWWVSFLDTLMPLADWQVWSNDENCWFRTQFRGKAAVASAAFVAHRSSSGGCTWEANLLFWQLNRQRCKCLIFEKANKCTCGSFSKQLCCSFLALLL